MIIHCAKCDKQAEASPIWEGFKDTKINWVVCEECKWTSGISTETHMPLRAE